MICPDCNATLDIKRHLQHEKTCPLAVGIDEICAEDAAWFRRHSTRSTRKRPVSKAEGSELLMTAPTPGLLEVAGDVIVTQVKPGVRIRNFSEVYFIVREGGPWE